MQPASYGRVTELQTENRAKLFPYSIKLLLVGLRIQILGNMDKAVFQLP